MKKGTHTHTHTNAPPFDTFHIGDGDNTDAKLIEVYVPTVSTHTHTHTSSRINTHFTIYTQTQNPNFSRLGDMRQKSQSKFGKYLTTPRAPMSCNCGSGIFTTIPPAHRNKMNHNQPSKLYAFKPSYDFQSSNAMIGRFATNYRALK